MIQFAHLRQFVMLSEGLRFVVIRELLLPRSSGPNPELVRSATVVYLLIKDVVNWRVTVTDQAGVEELCQR